MSCRGLAAPHSHFEPIGLTPGQSLLSGAGVLAWVHTSKSCAAIGQEAPHFLVGHTLHQLHEAQPRQRKTNPIAPGQGRDGPRNFFRDAHRDPSAHGWGYSFEIFRQFFQSMRPRYNGAPDCLPFFVDGPEAKAAGVSFNLEGDRQAVKLWLEAKDAADQKLMLWNQACERKRALIREVPELGSAA